MNPLRQEKVGQNILLKLATLVVILAGIKMSAEIVVPFILAMFLPSSLIRWSAC
ncbi:putative inner membrane protein YhhT [Erwinia amylovora MR1]|nr:putative inner membrane protein YhhT [Erwinia amylovora MR1]